uniref:Uncharacterized protein n=1 Tax=Arundo donax TaxID=35708 RepID=A0A0A9B6T2_ARUDO
MSWAPNITEAIVKKFTEVRYNLCKYAK